MLGIMTPESMSEKWEQILQAENWLRGLDRTAWFRNKPGAYGHAFYSESRFEE